MVAYMCAWLFGLGFGWSSGIAAAKIRIFERQYRLNTVSLVHTGRSRKACDAQDSGYRSSEYSDMPGFGRHISPWLDTAGNNGTPASLPGVASSWTDLDYNISAPGKNGQPRLRTLSEGVEARLK
eukprot:1389534-Amorphochlora_amoeboformis.AAC.1